MIFDFRLKVFYTVAVKLSYTKAANELFITQPAVTKHINELELQLQTRLFNRKGNSISLTSSGETLLRYAKEIFKLYTHLENELAEINDVASGHLQIGASSTIAQYILPRLIALFKKTYPVIDIKVITGNSDFIEQQIISEKIDIALVEGISHHPQINYESFVKDEIVLVVRTNNKFFQKNEIKANELATIPLVLREQGSGTLDVIHKFLSDAGIPIKELNVQIHLDSTESIKEYLMHADCLGFLSIHAMSKELQQNQLSIVDINGLELYRDFQFIQLHGHSQKLSGLFKRFCLSHYNLK
jgi:DNA-binding transcriptional LysR family regulator